jgi:glycine cleavage system H protein
LNVPDQLEYTRSHEWIRQEENIATVGITDYAQHMLGEIVSVGLPENGDTLYAGESFGTVKSAEFVSVLCAPVGGEVVEVNETLFGAPWLINGDPVLGGEVTHDDAASQSTKPSLAMVGTRPLGFSHRNSGLCCRRKDRRHRRADSECPALRNTTAPSGRLWGASAPDPQHAPPSPTAKKPPTTSNVRVDATRRIQPPSVWFGSHVTKPGKRAKMIIPSARTPT